MIPLPEIFISYPWWTILLVVITGLLYAGILYTRNPQNKLSNLITVVLFVFRFTAVSLLMFLLLSPTLKTKKKQIEKPIIIIGQDNSRSILMGRDSLYYRDTVTTSMNNLLSELSVENDVDPYVFGNYVKEASIPDYNDNSSNYSDFFNYIKNNYSGLNVGAIILVGDGIVNKGTDPVYAASNITYPIFTIALGDTSQIIDIKIDDVRYNSIVYSGDIFPVEINLSANMLKGERAIVKLIRNNKVIDQKDVLINNDNYRKTIKFNIEADKVGKQRYRLEIDKIEDEVNFENNARNIFIDVLNSRQKILILAYSPHPDIGAIKQSLLKNRNYQVETEYISGFNKNVVNYDLVILHQLPSKNNSSIGLLKSLAENEIPVLFILGKQSQPSIFNQYFGGLDILSSVGSNVSARFELNNSFTFFSFNDDHAAQLSALPPLIAPLGNYQLTIGAEVFGWQRINNLLTDFPLIAFYNKIGVKSGVISGEGLWLWRIHDNLQFDNSAAVDAFLGKAVMFLIADTDKRQFRVDSNGEYDSRLDVILNAELYNDALELDNSVDIKLVLTNENDEKFNFNFSQYDNYYTLNLNRLPVGVYTYTASGKLGNKVFSSTGEFIVMQLDNESRNLNANHRMLNRLAAEHDGAMYYPNQLNELQVDLNNLSTITSKVHYEDKFTGLNSIFYVMIILILLLSLEWFLRKYFGSY